MDIIRTQIKELQEKVDRLHQLVERIGSQLNTLTTESKSVTEDYSATASSNSPYHSNSPRTDSLYSMSHKDILVDDNSNSTSSLSSSEQELSPEIQIRRLTAQLTAAYNRIAALEEQLLSSRIHF
ncbi:MAG TPA: hypothetical protein ACFCUY_05600 [Xenococcaceae cyanobacterium]